MADLLEDLWGDIHYALRGIRKSPLFVLFVVSTLAVGIGANTTVFTVINTLILNPLPVPDPGELCSIAAVDSKTLAKTAAPFPLSYADLKDYQASNEVFRSLAGYTSPRVVTWQENGSLERLFSEVVTGSYFSTLGLTPAKGRFFLPEEDSKPGTHPVAVMNFATWQTRFGGADDIIGKRVRFNGLVFTIVGVAPRHFIGMNAIFGPDVWVPAAMAERLFPNEMQNSLSDRGKAVFQGVGRLKSGVTRVQALDNMETLAAGLSREYPGSNEGHSVSVRPIRDALLGSAMTDSSTVMFASAALLVVVGIVLLIACSNVANLLLARSAARQQEMAVRVAMGASRLRLIRQLLTESLMLGMLSGAAGMFIAYSGLQFLFKRLPEAANFVTPHIDATVFLFALFLSLATGLIFGAIPALKSSHASVAEALKEETRTAGRSRRRVTVANALLVGQVAFSFLLLVTAALFLRGIGRAYEMDPGFQTAHLAIFMTSPGQAGYGKTQTKAFYKKVREQVAGIPGVEAVSWGSNLPLWARPGSGLQVEGQQPRSGADRIRAIVNTVDLDYFEIMGVSLDSGRQFTNFDRETSFPVAIVNEKMAHDYWPQGALGKRIQLPDENQTRQIVGVARTADYSTWGEAPQACIYVPLEQHYSAAMTLYVRSKETPRQIVIPVQREIRAAAPDVLATDVRTGSDIVDGGLFQARMGVSLLSVFGLVALGLASIGLYGILAFSVSRRKREIGLRMALGATRVAVLGLILKEGLSLVLTGVLIGLVAASFLGQFLSGMLFGVSASDPISVAAAAGAMLVIALLACYLPARSASRVDPLLALREG